MKGFESVMADRAFEKITARPPLTPEREQELARRIMAGDDEAAHELALANTRFIMSRVFRVPDMDIERDDLFQSAFISTLKAARRYRPGYGKFISYAIWYVRHGIQSHRREARTFRMTAHADQQSYFIGRAIDEYRFAHGGQRPDYKTIAAATGIRSDSVRSYMAAHTPLRRLDACASDECTVTLHEIVAAEDSEYHTPQVDVLDRLTADKALASIANAKRREIVRRRYFGGESAEEIAASEGVSRQAIDLRLKKGLRDMRRALGVDNA